VQSVGAVIISSVQATDANYQSKVNNGKNIALGGLVLQVVFFAFFSIIAVRFHFVGRQLALPEDQLVMFTANKKRKLKPNWGQLLTTVNFGCLCILV
jgi:hypothetical protein